MYLLARDKCLWANASALCRMLHPFASLPGVLPPPRGVWEVLGSFPAWQVGPGVSQPLEGV